MESEKIISVEAINTLLKIIQLSFDEMDSKLKIETSQLPAGMYVLHVKTFKKEFMVKFFKM